MSDQKDIYNQVLARLVLRQNLASRDQIVMCLGQVSPEKDLGQVLIEQGALDFENYLKFHNYIHKLFTAPGGREKIREILASPTPPAPSPTSMGAHAAPPSATNAQTRVAQRPAPVAQPSAPQAPVAAQAPAQPVTVIATAAVEQEQLPAVFRGSPGDGQSNVDIPQQLNATSSLAQILLFARKHNASDVHLSPGSPILVRRYTRLKPVSEGALTAEQIREIIRTGIKESDLAIFMEKGDVEVAFPLAGGGRFRVTLIKQRFGWELTARVVPNKIRPFEQSGLPSNCAELTKWAQGLVLVTGPMGSGKTSTLVSLVEMINRERADHIITIERPVEFVFEPKRCQITQREVKLHTLSQANALRGALRQDPDIIVISELRDLESISLAVSAAETGHLVLATMNTANAQRTVNRIIDAFPPDEQDVIRNMISETLRGVISQQLVPLKDGSGVVPAYEVLFVTRAVSNLIRKNNLHQLPSVMLTGRGQGMQVLDDSLKKLLNDNLIEGVEAFMRASDPRNFQQYAPGLLKELSNG